VKVEAARHHTAESELSPEQVDISPIRSGLPRLVEATASLLGLIFCAPLLALAAAAVAFSTRGPVFFRQERIGRGGRAFILYKFRTMRAAAEGLQITASDDDRVTRIGKLLRWTKVDELPELWNVLNGDMSLVGPRPEVARYVDLRNSAWRMVLKAKPGITDPMTLRLRNEESLLASVEGDREKFYLEILQPFKLRGYLKYLHERTAWGDVKIIWKTVVAVIRPGKVPTPLIEVYTKTGEYHDVTPM
jgi:lipopolysaccharide/colanic/teichoic acid biosynthesis glycosyltransferase